MSNKDYVVPFYSREYNLLTQIVKDRLGPVTHGELRKLATIDPNDGEAVMQATFPHLGNEKLSFHVMYIHFQFKLVIVQKWKIRVVAIIGRDDPRYKDLGAACGKFA